MNFVYAKYLEKFKISYETKIAEPIFIVESDEKRIITDLENIDSEIYNFSIKNYDGKLTNSIKLFYQFEIIGIDDSIEVQLWDITRDEMIEITNGKSEYFSLEFDKKKIEYRLIVDFLNSNISQNTNINIKINISFDEEVD